MGNSEVEQRDCTIIWKVQNFNFLVENFDEKICSTSFSTKIVDNTSWTLGLYSKGSHDNLGCVLRRKHGGPLKVAIGFALYIVDNDGKDELLAEEISYTFEVSEKWRCETKKTIRQLKRKKSSLEDTILIKCHIWKPYPMKIISSISYSITQIEVDRHSFIWAIKSFSSNKPSKLTIPIMSYNKEKFDIELKNSTNESDSFVQIDFSSDLERGKAFYLVCKITLLDADGNTKSNAEQKHTFTYGETWRFPPFIEKSALIAQKSLYVPDDILNLKIDLFISEKAGESKTLSRFEFPVSYKLDLSNSRRNLASDLLRLYTERKLNDVILRAGSKDFPAHKSILGARSPVFDAMFQRDMLEKQTNFVDITDLDADTLNQLLVFIYTENLDGLDWEGAMKLYSAADKYQIQNLKDKCSSFLKSNLVDVSVCEVLILADDCQDHDLKAAVQNYLCIFGKEVLLSEKWKEFMEDKSRLANEIMHNVSLQLLKNM